MAMTLRQRIGGRPLEMETLLPLAIEIADALETAHAEGSLHYIQTSSPRPGSLRPSTPLCTTAALATLALFTTPANFYTPRSTQFA